MNESYEDYRDSEIYERPKEMSQTMKEAVIFANAHGGTLHRAPGGYWIREQDKGSLPHCRHYGTKTVAALVIRDVAKYTAWQEGRNGKFPIEMTIIKGRVE